MPSPMPRAEAELTRGSDAAPRHLGPDSYAHTRLVRWMADLTCYWCSATISDIRLDGPSARQVFPTEAQRHSIKPHLGQPRCAHCRGPFYMENVHAIHVEDPAILRIPARRGRPPKRPRAEAE